MTHCQPCRTEFDRWPPGQRPYHRYCDRCWAQKQGWTQRSRHPLRLNSHRLFSAAEGQIDPAATAALPALLIYIRPVGLW
jgi:hypothetical protein